MNPIDDAINLGIDFAGTVTFNELARAVNSGKFEVISIVRKPNQFPEYEVVLKARK